MEATGSPVLPRLQEGGKQDRVEGLAEPRLPACASAVPACSGPSGSLPLCPCL